MDGFRQSQVLTVTQLCVQAKDLRVGDVCRGSGARIVGAPSRGISTPTGCVDLAVSYPKHPDEHYRRTWRASTRIGINRPEAG